LKGWRRDKSIDNLSSRLHKLEQEKVISVSDDVPYASVEELQQMTPMERYIAWFNWHVREIMPYYKEEVMRFHNISDEEYDRRTLILTQIQSMSLPIMKQGWPIY
jgi:predicted ATPase